MAGEEVLWGVCGVVVVVEFGADEIFCRVELGFGLPIIGLELGCVGVCFEVRAWGSVVGVLGGVIHEGFVPLADEEVGVVIEFALAAVDHVPVVAYQHPLLEEGCVGAGIAELTP